MRRVMKKSIIYMYMLSIIIALIIVFFLWLNEDKIYTFRFYYENKETLNDISDYFSGLYEPSLNKISYDAEKNEFIKYYDKNKKVSVCDKTISSRIAEINRLYLANADYRWYYIVYAKYDKLGNMLLVVALRNHKIRESGDEKVNMTVLIHADADYDGSEFYNFNHNDEKPIDGNWYYWNYRTYLG